MGCRRRPCTGLASSCALAIVLLHPWAAALPAPAARGAPTVAPVETRLPADIVYRRLVKPDSAVTFSHRTHVELAGGRCTGCHPKPFPMLRRAPEPRHREMDAGGSCGACHDGKKAFATRGTASCRTCHSGMVQPRLAGAARASAAGAAGARRPPGTRAFPRGADSPGPVTFRHETHLRAAACAACHPKLFPMVPAAPRANGGMHERAACGACHDGKKAFACDDPGRCGRCHAGAGAGP